MRGVLSKTKVSFVSILHREEIFLRDNSDRIIWSSSFLENCQLKFYAFEDKFEGEIDTAINYIGENIILKTN